MANASSITIMPTAAVKEAFRELIPPFERRTGCTVNALWMPTMDMIRRLDSGEVVDLILLTGQTIDGLVARGIVAAGTRTNIARSTLGMAVRAGAPRPDMPDGEAFKQAMLSARSIAYSFGPSGVYVAELFQRLGIAETLGSRAQQVKGVPIGELVASGEAEIGFQQVSELLPVAGIDVIRKLPPGIERIEMFSAGLHAKAPQPGIACEFVRHLVSADAVRVLERTGLDPLTGGD